LEAAAEVHTLLAAGAEAVESYGLLVMKYN